MDTELAADPISGLVGQRRDAAPPETRKDDRAGALPGTVAGVEQYMTLDSAAHPDHMDCSTLPIQAGGFTPFAHLARPTEPNGSTVLDHADSSTLSFGSATKPADPNSSTVPSITIAPSRKPWPAPPGFEILGELGRGGMGVVYRARHTRLNRVVALKMIKGDDHPGLLERFRIEGEALARLSHPNVVQIFELGEFEGRPYFSLELLEGGSLWEKIASTPQDPRTSAELLAVIARAMQVAHDLHVIHRDLKPQNILFDHRGAPKVTDFGLAKRLDVESGLTRTQEIMGTPDFMAPEQALGNNDEVGPPADIYALGAILYVMLTGRPPFQGASWRETLAMVMEHDPVPPTRINPRVPLDLETICLRAIAKAPAKRYLTSGDLADDLKCYVEGRPILARPTPLWERAVKWVRRRPERAALLGASAAALIGVFSGAIWYGWHLVEQKRVAAEKHVKEERDAAEKLFTLVSKSRKKLEDANAAFKGGEFVAAGKSLEELEQEIKRELRPTGDNRQLEDTLSEVKAEARREKSAGDFRKRLRRFGDLRDEALLEATRAKFDPRKEGGGPEAVAKKAREALNVFTDEGKGGARSLREGGVPEGASSQEDRKLVLRSCYEMILILADAESSPPDSPGENRDDHARRVLRILESARTLDPEIDARAYHVLRGNLLASLEDEARAAAEREILKTLQPAGPLDQYLSGLILFNQGHPTRALEREHLTRAAAYFDAARRADPSLFWARALLAISYFNLGRIQESRLVLDECVALRKDKDLAWLYILRGFVSGTSTREGASAGVGGVAEALKEAEADFAAAQELARDKSDKYLLHNNRGTVRLLYNETRGAEDDFKEAIDIDSTLPLAYENLASVYVKREEYDDAIRMLSMALDLKGDPARKRQAYWSRANYHLLKAMAAGKAGDADSEAKERSLAFSDCDVALGLPSDPEQDDAEDHLGTASLLLMDAQSSHEPNKWAQESKGYAGVTKALALILAADPKSPKALADLNTVAQKLSDLFLDLDRFSEAIAACDEAIAAKEKASGRGSAPVEIYRNRGMAKIRKASPLKDKELLGQGLGDLNLAIVCKPERSDLWITRGWVRLLQRQPQEALEDFEEAIRLAPKGGEAYAGRGSARAAMGQIDMAVLDAREAQKGDGKSSTTTLYYCAQIYAKALRAAREPRNRAKGFWITPDSAKFYNKMFQFNAKRFLRLAMESLEPSQRATFFKKILNDPDLGPIAEDDGPYLRSVIEGAGAR